MAIAITDLLVVISIIYGMESMDRGRDGTALTDHITYIWLVCLRNELPETRSSKKI